jgi:phage terminase large subunit-like protein
LLDPAAARNQGFLDEWLRFYEDRSDFSGTTKYLIVDPANTEKKTSDYTAMAVIGLGVDQKYYLLDAIRDRLSLTERGDRLFAVHRRWRPRVVGYEKYGMQADIEYFKERMRQQNYRFEIIELGGHLAKNDRIRRMIPIFEECRFYLPYAFGRIDYEGRRVDLVKSFVEEEYRAFPVGVDDMFDCISRICDEALSPLAWPKAKLTSRGLATATRYRGAARATTVRGRLEGKHPGHARRWERHARRHRHAAIRGGGSCRRRLRSLRYLHLVASGCAQLADHARQPCQALRLGAYGPGQCPSAAGPGFPPPGWWPQRGARRGAERLPHARAWPLPSSTFRRDLGRAECPLDPLHRANASST